MLCENCMEKQASVHLTQIINSEKKEMHLCERCAREDEGFTFQSPFDSELLFSINSLLSGFMGKEAGYNLKPEKEALPPQCRVCGLTYHRFIQNGKLGCMNCYEVFNSTLEPAIKKIHGSTYHHGKVPKRSGEKIKVRKEIDILREQLKVSINREEYENAARIRDEIKLLEAKMIEEGS